MVPVKKAFSQAAEDYLKAIYELQEDEGSASTSGIAARLATSPAACTKMVKQLARMELIVHQPYHGVRLTASGEMVALEVIRHHRLIELYLAKALGYSWDEVHDEAEKLEHHISEDFEDRIEQALDYPQYDPHGDPIPSRAGVIPPLRGKPLTECAEGESLIILRVRDDNPEILKYLTRLGLTLETRLKITEKQPFGGPVTLQLENGTCHVGQELAASLYVGKKTEET